MCLWMLLIFYICYYLFFMLLLMLCLICCGAFVLNWARAVLRTPTSEGDCTIQLDADRCGNWIPMQMHMQGKTPRKGTAHINCVQTAGIGNQHNENSDCNELSADKDQHRLDCKLNTKRYAVAPKSHAHAHARQSKNKQATVPEGHAIARNLCTEKQSPHSKQPSWSAPAHHGVPIRLIEWVSADINQTLNNRTNVRNNKGPRVIYQFIK